MGNVVEFEVFRDHLGVDPLDPEIDTASKLYDAINAEIRRLTNRAFEGDEGATYSEVYRLAGAEEFTLRHVPVSTVTSIAKHNFDGTDEEAYEADRWRLEDVDRGLIRIRPTPEYVRVIYAVTGAIPPQAPMAALDWGKDRWETRSQPGGLISYQTGEDAESYSVTLAGRPPRTVLLALLGIKHITGGGVVR